MNDAVVVGADDELVGGVIIEAGYEVIDGGASTTCVLYSSPMRLPQIWHRYS